MSKKQPNINVGAAILFVIFCLLFFVLISRIIYIQVTGEAAGQPLAVKAQQKYAKEGVIEAVRGKILDQNGEVIAEDSSSYTLVAILSEKMKPNYVSNPKKTASELAKYINLKESEIYSLLTDVKEDTFQIEFGKAGRDISFQTKKEIENLKLPGITFIRDKKRFYPNGVFASHVIGYAMEEKNKSGVSENVGQLGIEKNLNDLLTGQNGSIQYESDLWEVILPDGTEKVKPAQNGKDVYLTLDKKIQTLLEDTLNKVQDKYNPKKMVAIVADPKTGEILAMGQRPTFHPKTREGIADSWHNEAIENSFEPGSTMKIFTLAAAVEENVFNPNEWFQSGRYKVTENSSPIHDHNYVGWGSITYLEGLQRSSNVAFAKLVKDKIGFETYRDYLTKFGFDQPTGIDLPNETGGKVLYNYPLEKITTGFGQGTAITPIQQVQAATAIANNGKMMQVHVVDKIVDPDTNEIVKDYQPEVVGTPVSADTAKLVRDYLETVVSSPKGTGFNRYNIDGYEVAGKTGTAQIPGPNGRYLEGHKNYIFSFLGMAPKDDPQLVIYVSVQQPEIDESVSGAEPVSEIFKPVMKNSLQYLNIEPNLTKETTIKTTPNLSEVSRDQAVKQLQSLGVHVEVLGTGDKIVSQLPQANAKLLKGEKVILKTDGDLTVPNMVGWSLRDSMKVAKMADLQLNIVGSGYVVKQNLQAGAKIKSGEYLILELETPQQQMEKAGKAESSEDSEDQVHD
jgi:penicillin-binding protein 2B